MNHQRTIATIVTLALVTVTLTSLGPLAAGVDTDVGAVDPVCEADPGWDTVVHCRELWRSRYNHPTPSYTDVEADFTNALAVSPDGGTIFAVGRDWGGAPRDYDAPAMAIDAATGERTWLERFSTESYDTYYAVSVSSDGATVYAAGIGHCAGDCGVLLRAIDAATGEPLWTVLEHGEGQAYGVLADPARDVVYVTAWEASLGVFAGHTRAYQASTGEALWRAEVGGDDLQLAPDGTALVVTGADADGEPTTASLDPATGQVLWSVPVGGVEITPSPDGTHLYVAGSVGEPLAEDYRVAALAAADGTTVWERVLDGPAGATDEATALAISPDGGTLVVTGRSWTTLDRPAGLYLRNQDAWTVALDPDDGDLLWEDRLDGGYGLDEIAWDVKLAPDGSTVYLAVQSMGPSSVQRIITRALDPATGEETWQTTTDGAWDSMVAFSGETLQVAPDGDSVYIGMSSMSSDWFDLVVVSYEG